MAYTPITNLPTHPSRQEPATFSERGDAFLGALPTFGTEVNAAGDYIDGKAAEVDADATAASASATAAADSATAAAASASAAAQVADAWVSGASFTEGDVVWSGVDYQTYRAKTTHSGLMTDPSEDSTNWQRISSGGVVNIEGATEVYVTQEVAYTITDFNSFSAYSVSVSAGSVSISDETITLTAPADAGDIVLTVTKDGSDTNFDLTILAAGVATPTNVSPTDGETEIGSSETLEASAFEALGVSDTHASSDWQLATDAEFNTIVDSSTDDTENLTSWEVTGLDEDTTYYWRVRYTGTNNGTSEYSTPTEFVTSETFGPTVIGEAFGGGFYAGNIVEDGTEYFIIVAPKSSGEDDGLEFKTSNTDAPSATQTLNNGPAASASMDSATYPAAEFCEGLTIGGFSDWYLPARDELELCYRNLKPTTTNNNTSDRAKSDITYPEGDDLSADTMGVNRNSNPTGSAYTTGSPAQTSATAFQTGNTEAFEAGDYWSSSEFDSNAAWKQDFFDGNQNDSTKGDSFSARAVRREAV
jgi:hypothetical protein